MAVGKAAGFGNIGLLCSREQVCDRRASREMAYADDRHFGVGKRRSHGAPESDAVGTIFDGRRVDQSFGRPV